MYACMYIHAYSNNEFMGVQNKVSGGFGGKKGSKEIM